MPGFRDFVDSGYYKMLREEKKTPYTVLKEEPHMRDKADVRIFKEYCQRFELLAERDDEFYQYLHQGVRVVEGFAKGDVIEPDPSVVRILWQGLVEPELPTDTYNRRKTRAG